MTELQLDEMINDYKNNKDIDYMLNKYNMNWKTFYGYICHSLRNSIKGLSKEDELEICRLYNEGVSAPKIGYKFGILHKAVSKVLDKYGIDRCRNGVRKHELNEEYFDKIDTPNKAYILGFLYADGYNNTEKAQIRLSLQYIDKEILELIRKEVGYSKELHFINQSKRKDKDNDYHYNDMYSLDIYSRHMSDTLEKIGMIKNKSLVLEFPDIDKNLYKYFIRGYFDGDGCFSYKQTEDDRCKYEMVTITSTESFCDHILSYLRKSNIIKGGGIYDASCHNGVTKVLSINGNRQVKSFLDWMYSGNCLKMKRKYDKYISRYYS